MYDTYYKLHAQPFRLSPDPRFFFTSATHKSALAYLRYGLYQGEGFVVVTGDAGTGKTMLVRTLLSEAAAEKVVAGELVTTHLDAEDLLRAICAAFDLAQSGTKASLLHNIERFLHACAREGKRVVLVVDEAHNLPPESFEELRMLSNFQVGARTLLQCVLLGQQPLKDTLAAVAMAQLQQRVIAAHHLEPLDAEETQAYIEHRLKRAGWQRNPWFSDGAYRLIHAATGGIPRLINGLCDRLLLAAALEERHHIQHADVLAVVRELAEEGGMAHEMRLAVEDSLEGAAAADQDSPPPPLPLSIGQPRMADNPPLDSVDTAAISKAPESEVAAAPTTSMTGEHADAEAERLPVPTVTTAPRKLFSPLRQRAWAALGAGGAMALLLISAMVMFSAEEQPTTKKVTRQGAPVVSMPEAVSTKQTALEPELASASAEHEQALPPAFPSPDEFDDQANVATDALPELQLTEGDATPATVSEAKEKAELAEGLAVATAINESMDTGLDRAAVAVSLSTQPAVVRPDVESRPKAKVAPETPPARVPQVANAVPALEVAPPRERPTRPASEPPPSGVGSTPDALPVESPAVLTAPETGAAKLEPAPVATDAVVVNEAIAPPMPTAARLPDPLEPQQSEALAAPAPAPVLSEAEAAQLLARFIKAYHAGDVGGLSGMFARDARTNDADDRDGIIKAYRKLFGVTDERELIFRDMHWESVGDHLRGKGHFGVTVRERGRRDTQSYTGRVEMLVQGNNGGAVITELTHTYDR